MKIYAGPGAGKTHFLVENIRSISENNSYIVGSKERKILCITYTNAAVDEIKARLDRYASTVSIHTIHGFIIEHIISYFQTDLRKVMKNDFSIDIDAKGKITSQVEGLNVLSGFDKTDVYNYLEDGEELDYSKSAMSKIEVDIKAYIEGKGSSIKKSDKVKTEHSLKIKEFIWAKAKKLTHDEILYFGYRVLQSNPTALYALRVRFPFIFVDEFQDTNPLQTMLIDLIREKSTIVGVIGDVAQSIYSFQGARPSQFLQFGNTDSVEIAEYTILGNRRSTVNIVNFCNFLRKSDLSIIQESLVLDDNKKPVIGESVKILVGNPPVVCEHIESVLDNEGVVLTRTWAAAFSYIKNITQEQEKILKRVNNAYYMTSIDLRQDIAEHSRVTWVKAFKFIFELWHGYVTGAFMETYKAFSMIADIDKKKMDVNVLKQIKTLSQEVFSDITVNTDDITTVDIIERFNMGLKSSEYENITKLVFDTKASIRIFDEQEMDAIKRNVPLLSWKTSYMLFSEVFAENSKYMTVHQAKGREWESVVVSLEPSKYDETSLDCTFTEPNVLAENPSDEFTRMYYVACSRAKKELYIHLKNRSNALALKAAIDLYNNNHDNNKIEYMLIGN